MHRWITLGLSKCLSAILAFCCLLMVANISVEAKEHNAERSACTEAKAKPVESLNEADAKALIEKLSTAEEPMAPVEANKDGTYSVPDVNFIPLCLFPCYQGQVQYNQNTLQLVSVDLFDANRRVWVTIPVGIMNQRGINAAMNALRAATQNVNLNFDCPEAGCDCQLPPGQPAWTPWRNISVSGEFSIPAPMGGAPLRYRANGTVDMRNNIKIGDCVPVRIES